MRAPKPPPASGMAARPPRSVDGRAAKPPHGAPTPATTSAQASASVPGPEILGSVWNGSQAVYVLDGRWVIEAWNPAAETLWGISAADAVGRPVNELFDWQPVSGPGRDISRIARGDRPWSERRIERPRVGSRRDELIVVDVTVAAERDPAGEVTRFIVSSHDVTRSVDLAAQMAALSPLGTAGGGVRDRRTVALEALEILCRATGADDGIVALVREGRYETLVEVNEGRFDQVVRIAVPTGSDVLGAVATPGVVLSGDPQTMPLRDVAKTVIGALGLRWLVATAIWNGDALVGLLVLGWTSDLPDEPAEPSTLEAAAFLSAALENARLVEELSVRYEAAQVLTARLEALVELGRLPEASDPIALAESVIRQLMGALGASAGALWHAGTEHWEPIVEVDIDEAMQELRATSPIGDLPAWGDGRNLPWLRSYDPAAVGNPAAAAAARAGYRSRAVFPVADTDPPTSTLILWFDRPSEEVAVDEHALEAIGRSVSVAFANQRMRAEIESSEQRYRTLFTDAPEAYVVTTIHGVITDMNPHAELLYRSSPGELVGRHVTEISEMDDVEYARRDAAMEQDGRAIFQGVGRRPDGSTFAQQLNVRRTTLDGEPRNLVHVRDTTEPDRLQAELLQAQKMEAVGQLVAGVAHELNNPLTGIIGFSTLLGRDPALPAELRSDAVLLVAEATRTKRIVENLLDFARHRPPERHPTRLSLLVQSVLDLQSYQFSDALRVDVDIPDDLPLVPLDRPMMQQVILNLTQNAIQAIRSSSGHGTISISASQGHDESGARVARLAVADDGPGVAEEHRDRLFLPFFTTKAPGAGTGLGLSVSFGIVAGHGGRLLFEPGLEAGSVFTVELPLEPFALDGPLAAVIAGPTDRSTVGPAAGARWDEKGAESGSAGRPRLRILVLDDEVTIRTLLERVLRRAVDVVAAATGSEALELIERADFDGMFCDHRMPGMTGTEVYERVAALRPELARHFVLMSGDVLNPELLAFAEGRAVRLLSKPFEIDTLQAIIDEMAIDIEAAGPR
ncbi:MAG TPA: PAS domain S-box protein [Candidatus Limnocylindrales bacterium]